MKLDDSLKNRLGIFFFYDKDGIVDRFIPLLLNDLCQNVRKVLIVCNGKLTPEGRNTLSQFGQVYVRDNVGFDVWAYKAGLELIGWDSLAEYDEVVLMNGTILGPIYPFAESFAKMAEKDLDFWGLTTYFKVNVDPTGVIPYGYIPDHIQSHFIVCRRTLIQSIEFREHWEKMPMIKTYFQSVGYHEAVFTKKMADRGFKWAVSVDAENLRKITTYPLMYSPVEMIREYRCPIFKRRVFFHDADDTLYNTAGEQATLLMDYLQKSTDYDTDLIWETVIRNYNQADFVKSMNLTYILPTMKILTFEPAKPSRMALVMHLYFPDQLEQSLHYASSIPSDADVYITTNSEAKKLQILEYFKVLVCNHLEVRVIANRGRDVSSLLIGVRDVIMNYEVVCFVHDKKSTQVVPGSVGVSFNYKCFENNLSSQAYVENVLNLFRNNPRLGLLTPPEPNHGGYFPTLGFEWGPNYKNTKKLAEQLHLQVPLDSEKPPVAPLGTMFWFRPKAMKPLYEKNWTYDSFPKEPNKIDGSLLHAIERIYPYVVQNEGYYPAYLMTDKYASIEYSNLKFYLRTFTNTIGKGGYKNIFIVMQQKLSVAVSSSNSVLTTFKQFIKALIKKVLPRPVYRFATRCFRYLQRVFFGKGKLEQLIDEEQTDAK